MGRQTSDDAYYETRATTNSYHSLTYLFTTIWLLVLTADTNMTIMTTSELQTLTKIVRH